MQYPSPPEIVVGSIRAARNSCLKPRDAWEMRVACEGAQPWTAQGPCSGVSRLLPLWVLRACGTVLSRVRLASPASP